MVTAAQVEQTALTNRNAGPYSRIAWGSPQQFIQVRIPKGVEHAKCDNGGQVARISHPKEWLLQVRTKPNETDSVREHTKTRVRVKTLSKDVARNPRFKNSST